MKKASTVSYSKVLTKYRNNLFRSDFIIIFVATSVTYGFRFQGFWQLAHVSIDNLILVLALPLFWLVSLAISDTWSFSNVRNQANSLRSILQASWRATLFMGFSSYLLHDSISRLWVFLTSGVIILCLILSRVTVQFLLSKKSVANMQESILVIAQESQEEIQELILPWSHRPGIQVKYIRVAPLVGLDKEKWLSDLESCIKENAVDAIIILPSAQVGGKLLARLTKYYYLGISAILLSTPMASEMALFKTIPHTNWVRIDEPHIVNSGYAQKRVFDLLFSTAAILVLSPVLLLIAIGVKISSRGPVLYTAPRIGSNGEYFNFPKFRSMIKGADRMRASVIGAPDSDIADRYRNDPRITKFGKFIRRWSLDELPQLFCVLKGTMSVVGPRPILEEELELVHSRSRYRSMATPGLTGLWQISGRKEVTWEDRMAMDTGYIQNWSFSHDLWLIAKTFAAIFIGRGSY